MLCPSVVLAILSERNSILTVHVDGVPIADIISKFFEESVDPNHLLEGVEYRHILQFRAGESDQVLFL